MNKIKLIIVILILPLVALKCNKKDQPKPTEYMTQEFKEYVLFPEGSWWVYENTHGFKDTVLVREQNIEIINTDSEFTYNFEWFIQELHSSYYHDYMKGWGGARDINVGWPNIYHHISVRILSCLNVSRKIIN